ncbi:helix-turn-helix domain-containing protein [Paraconexibacter sp.]|uniref:helix-turn-helix domain-containing protein n=1 Tax=Paraconexibacter sp. TaxID=2949640 RepID=UPI0035676F01
MPRIAQIIETLEAERADVQKRLDWLDGQIEQFREHQAGQIAPSEVDPAEVPLRSKRRATARRASSRRATARAVKRDTGGEILEFLAEHPGSTAGEVAKGIDLSRSSAAAKLTQMTKAGDLAKLDRGYAVRDA